MPEKQDAQQRKDRDQQIRPTEDKKYRDYLTNQFGSEMGQLVQNRQQLILFYRATFNPQLHTDETRALSKTFFGVEEEVNVATSSDPVFARQSQEKRCKFAYYAYPLIEDQAGKLDLSIIPSYGLYAPFYMAELKAYDKAHPAYTSHKGLLVGAATSEGANDFAFVLKSAFKDRLTQAQAGRRKTSTFNVQTDVMDMYASEQMKSELQGVNFILRNFLDLDVPLDLEPYDTIHTNTLLSDLHSNDNRRQSTSVRQEFLDQAYGMLKNGGRLIMVELDQSKNFVQELSSQMKQAGFIDIRVTYPTNYPSRRYVDRLKGLSGKDAPLAFTTKDMIPQQDQNIHGYVGVKK